MKPFVHLLKRTSKIMMESQLLQTKPANTSPKSPFQSISSVSPKMVVHCIAGVGRTGVFLAGSILWEYLNEVLHSCDIPNTSSEETNESEKENGKKEKILESCMSPSTKGIEKLKELKISVFHLIKTMRRFRSGMVETASQYSFVFKCLQIIFEELKAKPNEKL